MCHLNFTTLVGRNSWGACHQRCEPPQWNDTLTTPCANFPHSLPLPRLMGVCYETSWGRNVVTYTKLSCLSLTCLEMLLRLQMPLNNNHLDLGIENGKKTVPAFVFRNSSLQKNRQRKNCQGSRTELRTNFYHLLSFRSRLAHGDSHDK